jgi:phospholipid transport system transporter-binding protein
VKNQLHLENPHHWQLSGELTFNTVNALLEEFMLQVVLMPPKVIDLHEVTRTDSAGLALLIEMLRQTRNSSTIFTNIPSQLINIATLSGVEEMLTDTTSC